MALKKIIIDSKEIEVPGNLALIQACEEAGVEVPRFCYHERLSVAGNCRMCLVEVQGAPKPMASCAVTVNDLRPGPQGEPPVVRTNSPIVKKAREGVMEFLLANHPLDCPVCDQGGECDLQDQAMAYGSDKSRYDFGKRAVPDKELGPLVKTVMTRCIHCTRCVRFSTEVAGSPELGAIYRGEETEITPYLENIVTSELSANIIDLCPVGALTAKPYAFTARPWEMKKTETYDISDAMGSAIAVQARGNQVMRITPRNDDAVNEEWISNKARFLVDGLLRQRLDVPYIRRDGKLIPSTWEEALLKTKDLLLNAGSDVAFVAGQQTDIETLFVAKALADKIGAITEGRSLDAIPADNIAASRYNATFAITDEADAVLLIGVNPRLEASVLNARLRKAWLYQDAKIAVIGEQSDLTYEYTYLGADSEAVDALLAGHEFATILQEARRPLIIIGEGALQADAGILHKVHLLIEKYDLPKDSYNFLTTAISLGGVTELGFTYKAGISAIADKTSGVIVNLGNDDISIKATSIYIGSHGDKGALNAAVILPATAFTEKESLYITAEGRVRSLKRVVGTIGDAKEEWAILRAISEMIGQTLDVNCFADVRTALLQAYPALQNKDEIIFHDLGKIVLAQQGETGLYKTIISEFYLTDPICRASKTLHACQREFYDHLKGDETQNGQKMVLSA